jgi:hypothetical protein
MSHACLLLLHTLSTWRIALIERYMCYCSLLMCAVTLGKPIGNGYPMAAVVTTRAIAKVRDVFQQPLHHNQGVCIAHGLELVTYTLKSLALLSYSL